WIPSWPMVMRWPFSQRSPEANNCPPSYCACVISGWAVLGVLMYWSYIPAPVLRPPRTDTRSPRSEDNFMTVRVEPAAFDPGAELNALHAAQLGIGAVV